MQVCDKCKGLKKYTGIGYIEQDCPKCSVVEKKEKEDETRATEKLEKVASVSSAATKKDVVFKKKEMKHEKDSG